MKQILGMCCLCIGFAANAVELPALPSAQNRSSHSVFLYSEPGSQGFDSWIVDGGYMYNVFRDVDLYVGARVNSSLNGGENGFLSGVSYKISDRFSVKSTLYTANKNVEDNKRSEVMAAELSSRLHLTENLDLHATLDYQEWQQGIELGLGFRF
ncbi:hypothetical protein KW536_05185 [Vibrio fluvialis]|nr:hypothetical protein [Vibrio fluvialis]MBY8217714.1 hypothetical protein [Vibrio fluvialis]